MVDWCRFLSVRVTVHPILRTHPELTMLKYLYRWYLNYHSADQVLAGYGIGFLFGLSYYLLNEPFSPKSRATRLRNEFLDSRFAIYWRIRDGWSVYEDGGVEDEYMTWRRRRDEGLTSKTK